ncbi:MAG: fumarate hydratase [Firmicutes bacterium]|nr:fumarate hydratase [Bacillota bacterium]
MNEIDVRDVIAVVEGLCIESCTLLGDDWWRAIEQAIAREESTIGRDILNQLKENARLAANTSSAICQDTGIAVVFIELGQEVRLSGGNLYDAINEGVRRGYTKGYLRKSVLNDPVIRKNTGDNTPAIIHTQITEGNSLKIIVAPKGAGSENVSGVKMLKPSEGVSY